MSGVSDGDADSTLHEETTQADTVAIENTAAVTPEGTEATEVTEATEGEAEAAQPTSQFTEDIHEFCRQNNLSG